MLSQSAPILITSCRTVPAGTNGGVSRLGLAAAAAGGTFIGVVHVVLGAILFAASPAAHSRMSNSSNYVVDYVIVLVAEVVEHWGVIVLGGAIGLCGSLLDSILGATLQVTLVR